MTTVGFKQKQFLILDQQVITKFPLFYLNKNAFSLHGTRHLAAANIFYFKI